MKISIKVEGLKELESALMEIEKSSSRRTVVRNALKKAAEPIKAAMEAAAPVASGRLRGSIIIGTKLKGEAGSAAFAASMRAAPGDVAAAVAASRTARRAAKGTMPAVTMFVGPSERAFNAHFVEFGTSPHVNAGNRAGTRHPGTAPQPFARPAWDATHDKALGIIADEMRVQIGKAAARQANRRAKAAING